MENKVKITKRLSAYLLDIMFVFFLVSLITNIKYINPTYDKFIDAYEKYSAVLEDYYNEEITAEELNELNKDNVYNVTKYSISSNIVIVLVVIGYFGFFQKFNNGQTLGKKIMKIKIVGIDDKNINLGRYILRTLPMYYIYIGSIIPLLLNSILIFILKAETYTIVNSVVVYLFFILGIVSFVMMNVREDKRGIQDLISGTKVVME